MADGPRLSIPPAPPGSLWTLVLLASAATLALAAWVAPLLSVDPRLAYAIGFTFVGAELLAAAALAPTANPRRWLPVAVLLSGGVLFALHGSAPSTGAAIAVTLALLGGASVFGAAIGTRIEQPGHLLAVAVVSTLVDMWSVFDTAGVSARMAEQVSERPDQLAVFALPWPMLGTPSIAPIIGAGDIVFVALYVAALRRHALPVGRTLVALSVALAVGLVVLLAWERAIPLLPLLGAAVILVEPQARRLQGRDRKAFVGMLVVLAALFAYRVLAT